MRRALPVALLLCLAVPAGAQDQADPAAFFRKALMKDKKTAKGIRTLLKTQRGYVDQAIQFADITGDGKSDAIVRVQSGGIAGVRAVYVFSTDGGKSTTLRVVFRRQSLYRASASVSNASNLLIRELLFHDGDDLCCPSEGRQRIYAWDAKANVFRRISTITFPIG